MLLEEIAFRKYYLFNKEEIIESINLTIEYYEKDEELNYTTQMRQNIVEFYKKFLHKINQIRLPELTELWKYYDYEITNDSLLLSLCEANDIELDEDDLISSMSTDNQHILVTTKCKYLTTKEFAEVQEVTVQTVTNWIKRGKLKNAKLINNTWMIPEIEEKPERGYTSVHYLISEDESAIIDEYPLVSLSKSIFFNYNEEDKSVACSFRNSKTSLSEKMTMDISEAEQFEYKLILTGKAKVDGRVQFVPIIDRKK